MKTSTDPRHVTRRLIVQDLFAYSFDTKQVTKNIIPVIGSLDIIDQEISQAAPEWPLSKINRIDLAILRLAAFELITVKKEPLKVIIDEAIELAKEFGAEGSPAFVNGALGSIVKKFIPEEQPQVQTTT